MGGPPQVHLIFPPLLQAAVPAQRQELIQSNLLNIHD